MAQCSKTRKSSVKKDSLSGKDRGQLSALWDLNVSVATLRDLLVDIGRPRDGPEIRERIRRARQHCIEAIRKLCDAFIPLICKDVSEGIPVDNEEFIILFNSLQLLQRELCKCYRLLSLKPIDMSQYNDFFCLPGGSRASMSVLGHMVMSTVRPLAPEWNAEDRMALEKELNEVTRRLQAMQQYLPCEGHHNHNQSHHNCQTGRQLALTGEDKFSQWQKQRHKHKISPWSFRKRYLRPTKSNPTPTAMLRMLPFALLPTTASGISTSPPGNPSTSNPTSRDLLKVDECNSCDKASLRSTKSANAC